MEDRKTVTCCFTGHRIIPDAVMPSLRGRLSSEICRLFREKGITDFCAGGAVGFDTAAAEAVIAVRASGLPVRLRLILPCKNQSCGWKESDRRRYDRIMSLCDSAEFVQGEYSRECMFIRNRRLCDAASVCICYLTGKTGGTSYTVKYAASSGLEIINLAGDARHESERL